MNDNINDVVLEEIKPKTKFKDKIKLFFSELVKHRTKEDYNNILLCNDNDVTSNYPWLSIRFFVIGFVIYSISMFICYINKWVNNYYFPYSLGCVFIGISLLILIYEISKKKELGLLKVLFIGLIGGLISLGICMYVSSKIRIDNVIYTALKTGILEEVIKGITSIVSILIIQKISKNKIRPITGLIIGCSIGAFFGVIENFSYIFIENSKYIIDITMIRGFDQIVTHMFWSGLISYFFVRCKKPMYLLIGLLSILLHTVWDIDYNDRYSLYVNIGIIVYSIICVFFVFFIIYKNNKKEENIELICNINKKELIKTHLLTGLSLCALVLLITVNLGFKGNFASVGVDKYNYYMNYDEFASQVSEGYSEKINRARPYDDSIVDYDRYYKNGKLEYARQVEIDKDIKYIYLYKLDESDNLYVAEVSISIGEEVYSEHYLNVNNDDTVVYYEINEEMSNNSYYFDNGKVYTVITEYHYLDTIYILLGIAFACLCLGGVVSIVDYEKYKKELEVNE